MKLSTISGVLMSKNEPKKLEKIQKLPKKPSEKRKENQKLNKMLKNKAKNEKRKEKLKKEQESISHEIYRLDEEIPNVMEQVIRNRKLKLEK